MNSRHRRTVASLLLGVLLACSGDPEAHQKVVWTTVREGGVVATFLRPKGAVVRHAVVVVGGSEGGIPEGLGYAFAERGWAVLAVGYFGAPGLPAALANIPIEGLDGAVAWLQRQPALDLSDLTLVGVSRGTELALLYASQRPAIRRVIVYGPSHVVWGPVGVFADPAVSAWTRGGRPLPYVSHVRAPDYAATPYRGTPDFLADLRQAEMVEAAAIPVEQIHGPILLLSGDDDQVWPSSDMAKRLLARLTAAHHPYRDAHVSFPGAGHLIGPGADPGLLTARHPVGVVMAFGGTRRANRDAQTHAWAQVLAFLRTPPAPRP